MYYGRGIVIIPDAACNGCGRCVDACKRAFLRQFKGKQKPLSRIKLIRNETAYFPVLCRNCTDAPCVTACMTGCRFRNKDGLVTTDYTRCVGCWMCVMSCPFGAIERDMDGHVAYKCDGCPGSDVAPCVEACDLNVLGHLYIGDIAGIIRQKAAVQFLSGNGGDK